LITDAYTKYIDRIGRPPAPMTADYAAAFEHSRVWVLVSDDAMVGALVTEDRGDHLLLETVAVAPAAQGHGYGRLLLDRANVMPLNSGTPKSGCTPRFFAFALTRGYIDEVALTVCGLCTPAQRPVQDACNEAARKPGEVGVAERRSHRTLHRRDQAVLPRPARDDACRQTDETRAVNVPMRRLANALVESSDVQLAPPH
jgi:GNAT superfamily N-acetyltransferase